MLPSSSDLGRQPPQAGNGGLNPSGSANSDRFFSTLMGWVPKDKPMLPSSSDLGRQPPQAGNGGLNPSGSATTKCPRIGAAQWTCSYEDCVCHLKETIPHVLPSSSDLGRQPPQAGNGGLNPSGSAIQCGYPLCDYYHKDAPVMTCPTPIEGTACEGHPEHPPTCRCETCRFWGA